VRFGGPDKGRYGRPAAGHWGVVMAAPGISRKAGLLPEALRLRIGRYSREVPGGVRLSSDHLMQSKQMPFARIWTIRLDCAWPAR
jgi:hypothetical protein